MRRIDPHAGQPVFRRGPDPSAARLCAILVHGRGGSPDDMLALAGDLDLDDIACLAPEAADHTWYPYSFLAPLDRNEPWLSSALGVLEALVASLPVGADRVALVGFSQGACLSLEFAARHPRRYAAVIGLSGGVIGPEGTVRDHGGSLAGTPVFIGCSETDPHIPLPRVRESAALFRALGASVDERIYPRMGHTVNEDEIEAVRHLLSANPPHAEESGR